MTPPHVIRVVISETVCFREAEQTVSGATRIPPRAPRVSYAHADACAPLHTDVTLGHLSLVSSYRCPAGSGALYARVSLSLR